MFRPVSQEQNNSTRLSRGRNTFAAANRILTIAELIARRI
jgi:hypothetical protein